MVNLPGNDLRATDRILEGVMCKHAGQAGGELATRKRGNNANAVISAGGDEIRYITYLPPTRDEVQGLKNPLAVCLHVRTAKGVRGDTSITGKFVV